MKTSFFPAMALVLACCLGGGAVGAQSVAYRMNVPYVLPRTAVKVTLSVVKEEVKKGPYAKYAQQYLGVQAPLTDKVNYAIAGASLSAVNEAEPSSILILDDPSAATVAVETAEGTVACGTAVGGGVVPAVTEGVNSVLFNDMGISPIVYTPAGSLDADRRTAREKTTEEMAADAAGAIFTLRKRRFDLITGESGENVFGAGLKAALDEMQRLEDRYLALFVGNKTVTRTVQEFEVVPEPGKNNIVVCRFSKTGGLVDLNDMTGEPVVLSVNPEGRVQPYAGEPKKGVKGLVAYRVADMAQCRLFNGQELLAVKRLPIYQFGTLVEAVLPSK